MNHPLLALPISITLVLIAGAFGRRLLGVLGVKPYSALERNVFGIALGLGATAYLVLAVGLMGFLYPAVLGGLVLLIGVVSVGEFVGILQDIAQGIRNGAQAKTGFAAGLIVFAIVTITVLTLIPALAPPAGMDWDGLSYHLAVPKIYLRHHAVIYVPFTSHSNFPFLIEMLYTLGLAFGSVGAAKLFHFACYALSAMAVYSMGRRHLSSTIGAVGALIFMTVPVVVWEAATAYADIATALYVTLAVYAVANRHENKERAWLILAGIMCGFALGTKVFAAVPTIALCVWVLLSEKGRGLKPALALGLIALAVGSPWYIKSYVCTGNPVYPFLYNVFGGKYWSAQAAEGYRGAQNVFGMGKGLRELLMFPWNLTMNGAYFFDDPNPEKPKLFSLLGGAFLAFIPLGIIAGRRSRLVGVTALVCAAYLIAWFFLMQQVRYLIGIVPLMALLAAWGLDAANERMSIARIPANGVLALLVSLSILTGYALAADPMRVALGLEPTAKYLARTLDSYRAQEYINDYLPDDARVLFFDEVRGFYLDREYMWANPGHHEMTPWSRIKTGPEMIRYFRGKGFTHVLLNWNLAEYAGQDRLHTDLIPQAIGTGKMREIHAANNVCVYELVDE